MPVRTLGEIANEAWRKQPYDRDSTPKVEREAFEAILAALREAVAQRDEWWRSRGHVDGKGGCFYEDAVRQAVAQERAALREWAEENKHPYDDIGPDELDYQELIDWLDARQRSEKA